MKLLKELNVGDRFYVLNDEPFHLFASSTTSIASKKLSVAIGRKYFKVTQNSQTVYEGDNITEAVKAYNHIIN